MGNRHGWRAFLALGLMLAALAVGAAPGPAGAAHDGLASCAERGYAATDAFPSLGLALLELDARALTGLPLPAHPAAMDEPLLLEFGAGSGDTVVCRSDPLPPGCQSDCTVETEIIQLALHGDHPVLGTVRVEVDPLIPSAGAVTGASVDPLGNIHGGESFFDVFLEIEVVHPVLGTLFAETCLDPSQPGTVFCTPFRVQADLDGVFLPPVTGVSYDHPFGQAVPLWVDPDPDDPEGEFVIGSLTGGCHKPYDPEGADEHHVCILASGPVAPKLTDPPCLEGPVRLFAGDVAVEPHDILAITSSTTGPLTTTPWKPTLLAGVIAWEAVAVSDAASCADVGLTAEALFTDGHASHVRTVDWKQRL